jgi:hypothetical protein
MSTNLDAVTEFLGHVPVEKLDKLAFLPAELTSSLSIYLPETEGDEGITPDSQESAEAATMDERNLSWAAIAWWTITPAARTALVPLLTEVAGKEQMEMLLEQFDLMRPL